MHQQVDHARQILLGELRRLLPGITEKMLASHLREMEADGVVHRVSYDEVPPRVENSLTEEGTRLNDALQPLAAWGRERPTGQRPGKRTVRERVKCRSPSLMEDGDRHGHLVARTVTSWRTAGLSHLVATALSRLGRPVPHSAAWRSWQSVRCEAPDRDPPLGDRV